VSGTVVCVVGRAIAIGKVVGAGDSIRSLVSGPRGSKGAGSGGSDLEHGDRPPRNAIASLGTWDERSAAI
jgi:hypothetical protein